MNAKAVVDQANAETFMTRLKADWRQYVIYAGFVVIFIFFSITLNDKGFLDAKQSAEYCSPDGHDRHHGGGHDFRLIRG